MEIDIRKSIINNFKDSNEQDITTSINESIKQKDEIILPGLGVFFELLWKNSNDNQKKTIVEIIKNSIQ